MGTGVIEPPKPVAAALRRHLAFPACVVELALLGSLISGSILILTTSGAALFLTDEGSEAMPVFYVLLAGVSIPLASGVSAVLSRWLTLQVSAALCLASALLALALWGMAAAEMPGAAYAAYIAAYSLEILYDTLFWLLASEYLTTLDMKRYAAQLAMAFGAGGVGGGMLASLLSQYVATQTLLLVAGFLFVLSFLQCLRIGRRLTRLGDGEDEEEDEGGVLDAVRALAGTVRSFPLVGAICGGILLMSALFCLQDYLAMTVYAEAYADEDDLAGFLAVVYSAQQAAELVILALFGRIVLERGGPLPRNLIFPADDAAQPVRPVPVLGPAGGGRHAHERQRGIQRDLRAGQDAELRRHPVPRAGAGPHAGGRRHLSGRHRPVGHRADLAPVDGGAAHHAAGRHRPGRAVRRGLLRRRGRLPAEPAAQPPPARGGSRRPTRTAGREPVLPGRHPAAGKPSRPAGQALCRRLAEPLRGRPAGAGGAAARAAASGRSPATWSTARRKPGRRRRRRWDASATPPSAKRCSG